LNPDTATTAHNISASNYTARHPVGFLPAKAIAGKPGIEKAATIRGQLGIYSVLTGAIGSGCRRFVTALSGNFGRATSVTANHLLVDMFELKAPRQERAAFIHWNGTESTES
tara:strand:+ start:1524 stop:1859 length:336 start_codon:yes stop_codon:yes gene_type:complete